jgi:hypothetical protein
MSAIMTLTRAAKKDIHHLMNRRDLKLGMQEWGRTDISNRGRESVGTQSCRNIGSTPFPAPLRVRRPETFGMTSPHYKVSTLNYNISTQQNYVLVERLGFYEVDLNVVPVMLAEIAAACEKAGCSKVLLLGRETKVNLSPSQILRLAEQISESNLQIAVVESHDATHQEVSFLRAIVLTRGRPIQFFDSELDARKWLGISPQT